MLEKIILAVIVGFVAFVAYALYLDTQAEHFSLRKDQWECTQMRTVLMPQMVGKVTIMAPHAKCQQWSAR